MRDFPGGPVVKNLPSNAADKGLTPGQGTQIPHAVGLLNPLQLCPALYEPMDCSPPGSSVHRISQAKILEWAAISSSRGSSRPGDRTRVSSTSCAGRWILDHPGSPNSHVEASVSHRGGCSLWPMDQTVPAACFCTALELRMVSTYLKVVKSRERRAHGPQASWASPAKARGPLALAVLPPGPLPSHSPREGNSWPPSGSGVSADSPSCRRVFLLGTRGSPPRPS